MKDEKFLIATNNLGNIGPNGLTAFYAVDKDKSDKGNFTYHIPAAIKYNSREEAERVITTHRWRDCFIMSTSQL